MMMDSEEGSWAGTSDGDNSNSGEESGSEFVESTLAPKTPPTILMSRWCVRGMQYIYRDDIYYDN